MIADFRRSTHDDPWFVLVTVPLFKFDTKTTQSQLSTLSYRGIPYLALHKHIVQEKIMYTSELSIYHTSYLFIQRIALFRSSFIDASCALVFNFVISFSYSKITLQISRFQFDSSILYVHLIRKFHTQIRDFILSTRIVNFIHNFVHKSEISIGRRE